MGDQGKDILYGGAGDDYLNAGSGNSNQTDELLYNSVLDGNDIIDGFDNSGGAHDILDLSALFDDLGVADVDRAAMVQINPDGGGNTILTIDHALAGAFSITLINIADPIAGLTIGSDLIVS